LWLTTAAAVQTDKTLTQHTATDNADQNNNKTNGQGKYNFVAAVVKRDICKNIRYSYNLNHFHN
jgi:hypothetical protein